MRWVGKDVPQVLQKADRWSPLDLALFQHPLVLDVLPLEEGLQKVMGICAGVTRQDIWALSVRVTRQEASSAQNVSRTFQAARLLPQLSVH